MKLTLSILVLGLSVAAHADVRRLACGYSYAHADGVTSGHPGANPVSFDMDEIRAKNRAALEAPTLVPARQTIAYRAEYKNFTVSLEIVVGQSCAIPQMAAPGCQHMNDGSPAHHYELKLTDKLTGQVISSHKMSYRSDNVPKQFAKLSMTPVKEWLDEEGKPIQSLTLDCGDVFY